MTYTGFGDRLAQERREKAARDRRDVLQRDVAEALGTTPATVSRWEDGTAMPRDEMMERLAAYFGVTPAWLRYGQEPRQAATAKPTNVTVVEDEADVMTEPPPHLRQAVVADQKTADDQPDRRRRAR